MILITKDAEILFSVFLKWVAKSVIALNRKGSSCYLVVLAKESSFKNEARACQLWTVHSSLKQKL